MFPARFQPTNGMDDFLLFITEKNSTTFSFMDLLDEQKVNLFSAGNLLLNF